MATRSAIKVPFVVKSVTRRMKRYSFLVIMIAVGIMAVTLVQAVTVGMSENVIEGSARYLGGRYLVVGRESGSHTNAIQGSGRIVAAIEKAGFKPSIVARREIAGDNEPTLFFNGESFKVRRVSGVDFEAEAPVFAKLAFTAGGAAGLEGTNAILVSKQVAERFGVRLGDEITLSLKNNSGFLDSAPLVVKGIFRDASIFGFYNCYVDFAVLSRLMGEGNDVAGSLGFYLKGAAGPSDKTAQAMTKALSDSGFSTFSKLESKDDADAQAAKGGWEGLRYGVLPVEKYIDAKVMDLIHAIQIVSYLFLVMMLIIILVGMRNTTELMIRKRTKEIGTIRALGMSEGGARRLILGESLIVASIGFLIGLAAAAAALLVLQCFPFDWSDGFDIFLKKGHVSWQLSPPFLALNYIALCLMTAAGSGPAAKRAAAISPAAAIASIE
jgi:ABC-type lipoprotein release transport system permease subunit